MRYMVHYLPLGHLAHAIGLLLADTQHEMKECVSARWYAVIGPLEEQHVLQKPCLSRLKVNESVNESVNGSVNESVNEPVNGSVSG